MDEIAGTAAEPLTTNVFPEEADALDVPVAVVTCTRREPGVAAFAMLIVVVRTLPAGFTLRLPTVIFESAVDPFAPAVRNCTDVAPVKFVPLIVNCRFVAPWSPLPG